MGLSLRHWRTRHLVLAWVAYWIVALLVALRGTRSRVPEPVLGSPPHS